MCWEGLALPKGDAAEEATGAAGAAGGLVSKGLAVGTCCPVSLNCGKGGDGPAWEWDVKESRLSYHSVCPPGWLLGCLFFHLPLALSCAPVRRAVPARCWRWQCCGIRCSGCPTSNCAISLCRDSCCFIYLLNNNLLNKTLLWKPLDFPLHSQPQSHQSFCVSLEGQSRVYIV